jgi:hypothetical protein
LIPEIVRELRSPLAEVKDNPKNGWIAERIIDILAAFAESDPTEWEYDFG